MEAGQIIGAENLCRLTFIKVLLDCCLNPSLILFNPTFFVFLDLLKVVRARRILRGVFALLYMWMIVVHFGRIIKAEREVTVLKVPDRVYLVPRVQFLQRFFQFLWTH